MNVVSSGVPWKHSRVCLMYNIGTTSIWLISWLVRSKSTNCGCISGRPSMKETKTLVYCTSFLLKHTITSSYCTHTHAWSPTLTSHSKGCNCVHSHNTDKVVGEVTDGKTWMTGSLDLHPGINFVMISHVYSSSFRLPPVSSNDMIASIHLPASMNDTCFLPL